MGRGAQKVSFSEQTSAMVTNLRSLAQLCFLLFSSVKASVTFTFNLEFILISVWLLFYTTSSNFIKMQILFIVLEWCICLKALKPIMLNVCWHSVNIITGAPQLGSWISEEGPGTAAWFWCLEMERFCARVTDSLCALFRQVASPLRLLPICRIRLRPNCLRVK